MLRGQPLEGLPVNPFGLSAVAVEDISLLEQGAEAADIVFWLIYLKSDHESSL